MDMTRDRSELDACQGKPHTCYLLPTLVYIVVMMVVGLIGNSVAVVVYYQRYKPSTTRTLILSLSMTSLAANLVCCPEKIAELCLHEAFDERACGTFTALHASLTFFSASLLTVVASDRQRRVCAASQSQLTEPQAKKTVGVCGILSAGLSSPFFGLGGVRTETLRDLNVSVVTCSMYEAARDYLYLRYLHFAVVVVVLVASTVIIVASYVRIARHIRRHQKLTRCLTMTPAAGLSDGSDIFSLLCCVRRSLTTSPSRPAAARRSGNVRPETESTDTNRKTGGGRRVAGGGSAEKIHRNTTRRATAPDVITQESEVTTPKRTAASESCDGDSTDAGVTGGRFSADFVRWRPWMAGSRCLQAFSGVLSPMTQRKAAAAEAEATSATTATEAQSASPVHRLRARRKDHPAALSRTTLTLIVVTVIFVVSYLPSLLMVAVHLVSHHSMTPSALNAHFVFLYSSFIGFTVNPIVYSVGSAHFRRHCKQLFIDLRRKSEATPQREEGTCSNTSCEL